MCGVAAVQFRNPEAGLVFDVDGDTGKRTRRLGLEMDVLAMRRSRTRALSLSVRLLISKNQKLLPSVNCILEEVEIIRDEPIGALLLACLLQPDLVDR